MNAVIALCHFCESHGPAAIFCTQKILDIKDLNAENPQNPNKSCPPCNSIGSKLNGFISTDETNNIHLISTQAPIFKDVSLLVKQASVRSLSCEISNEGGQELRAKDGGIVFFGDSSRGHVLSHTFHIKDIQARGFYQLFSIIIIMKDKYYLLNIQPFLAEHLKRISKELQNYAQKIYDFEDAKISARDRHMSNANQVITLNSRSLIDLTGEENIFAILHAHFSWLLLAGSHCLKEQITLDNLPWLLDTKRIEKDSMNQIENSKSSDEENPELDDEDSEENLRLSSLRNLKEILGNNFIAACYCTIAGIKILIRGPPDKTNIIIMCLKKLLPDEMHKLIHLNSLEEFLTNSSYRITTVMPDAAVPMPNNSIFRIDIDTTNKATMKWLGDLPPKYPDLLVKILKAVDDSLLNDLVLVKRIQVLIEDWKSKVICLARIRSTTDLFKLKKVLGIQVQDQQIINYWQKYLNLSFTKK